MIEEYVIKELDTLKEENRILKNKINELENRKIVSIEDNAAVYINLKSQDFVIKTLEKNGYDLQNIVDNYGGVEMSNLIKSLDLYRDYIPQHNRDIKGIVRIDKKYYEVSTYYNDYRMENEVFMDVDTAIYNDLTDKLYDMIQSELRKRQVEAKKVENNE